MNKNKKKILIVGAGVAGKELLIQLRSFLRGIYDICGFIDDDLKIQGKSINKTPVLGQTKDIQQIIKSLGISEVFIAIPSAKGETIRKIIKFCAEEKVKFKIVPRVLDIVLGKVNLEQVREVQIEDLLGRPILKSSQAILIKEFEGKKILVTGGAGSIGSELCKQIVQFSPKTLIALDWWENGLFDLGSSLKVRKEEGIFKTVISNIQESEMITNIFNQIKPDIVFHAAAFKHVPLMQENPLEAVKNNIIGTENVAKAAAEAKVKKFINVSTDKAASPINIMGATKYFAERIVSYYNSLRATNYISVRFGNVMDSHGSVIPIFRRQIKEGGPVTVTDPQMSRFFMTIPEAVQLMLQASLIGSGGEVFVLDMGNPIKIDDLARLMISLAGFIPDQEIKIDYIGKRAGEKISEVLSSDSEELIQTTNEKIFQIRKPLLQDSYLADLLDEMKKAIAGNDKQKAYDILREEISSLEELPNL